MIHARLTPEIKKEAESILKELGISVSAAHELFYRQIIVNQGLPFELRVMKKETIHAMNDARNGKGEKYDSVNDIFEDLGINVDDSANRLN